MSTDIVLRPTTAGDLDFVLALERHPENAPFIGQWSREEHLAALERLDREHWIVTDAAAERLGYVILYDLRDVGHGVYVKRIAVGPKSSGIGRRALAVLLEHAFADLRADFVSLAVYAENERAQRAYQSVGFATVELADEDRRTMQAEVDPFPDHCLVMVARPGPRA